MNFINLRSVFNRKVRAKNPQLSITQHVAHYSGNHSDGIDLGTEMWIFK